MMKTFIGPQLLSYLADKHTNTGQNITLVNLTAELIFRGRKEWGFPVGIWYPAIEWWRHLSTSTPDGVEVERGCVPPREIL